MRARNTRYFCLLFFLRKNYRSHQDYMLENGVYLRTPKKGWKKVYLREKNVVINSLFDHVFLFKIWILSSNADRITDNKRESNTVRLFTLSAVHQLIFSALVCFHFVRILHYLCRIVGKCSECSPIHVNPNTNVYSVHANAVEALRQMRFHYAHNRTQSHI